MRQRILQPIQGIKGAWLDIFFLFAKSCVYEMLNLQCDGRHAKPYQVKQVRMIVARYRLWCPSDE